MKTLKQNVPFLIFLFTLLFGSLWAAKRFDNPEIRAKIEAHSSVGAASYEIVSQELTKADWFYLRGQYKIETNYFATPSGLVECLSISK